MSTGFISGSCVYIYNIRVKDSQVNELLSIIFLSSLSICAMISKESAYTDGCESSPRAFMRTAVRENCEVKSLEPFDGVIDL